MSTMKKMIVAALIGISALTAVTPIGYIADAHGIYQENPYYKGSGYQMGIGRIGLMGNTGAFEDAYDAAFEYVIYGRRPRMPAGMSSDLATRAGWQAGVEDATNAYKYGQANQYPGAQK